MVNRAICCHVPPHILFSGTFFGISAHSRQNLTNILAHSPPHENSQEETSIDSAEEFIVSSDNLSLGSLFRLCTLGLGSPAVSTLRVGGADSENIIGYRISSSSVEIILKLGFEVRFIAMFPMWDPKWQTRLIPKFDPIQLGLFWTYVPELFCAFHPPGAYKYMASSVQTNRGE